MRRVIEGKAYDTTTATLICDISPIGLMRDDFEWEDTSLYRTAKGAFFLAGEGGAKTRWNQTNGKGAYHGGDGIELVTEDQARALVERHAPRSYEDHFGPAEEG